MILGHGETTIPFTPFHFGPGLLVKAIAPRTFWLSSFLLANILIDVEVLYYLVQNSQPVHRYFHSYISGMIIGIISGLIPFLGFSMLGETLLAKWKLNYESSAYKKNRLLLQSLVAGLVGGISHIFLDSLMHQDMHPFWPFSEANGMLGVVSHYSLHLGCFVSGIFGLLMWLLMYERKKK